MTQGKKTVLFSAVILTVLLYNGITEAVTVTVDPKVEYQEFEGWGTSICWWGNIIPNYPQRSRDSIMYFFSIRPTVWECR